MINPESAVLPIWQPILKRLEKLSEATLTIMLLLLAAWLIWLALQKDHAILKAVVLTYIFLP